MSEEFDGIVTSVVDEELTLTTATNRDDPDCCGISCVVSGTCVQNFTQLEDSTKNGFTCRECGRRFKTEKGCQNHLFLHKISNYNQRKPDIEFVGAITEDLIILVLTEIKNEENVLPEKKEVIQDLDDSRGSPNWINFLQVILDPICSALTARTKLLPSNQYEEFLFNFNKFLNCKNAFNGLMLSFQSLVSENHRESGVVRLILFRLCSRLPEEIQICISKEMAKTAVSSHKLLTDSVVNEEAFVSQISNMLRSYFIKGSNFQSEVWRLRCSCIKSTFVNFLDDATTEENNLKLKCNWISGDIAPSPSFLRFCEGVENIIKFKMSVNELNLDDLVTCLLDPEYSDICNYWYSLTVGYLSEIDSLVFMRDFVAILLAISMKLEEALICGKQEESQKLRKVAVRENLKRN